MSIPLKVRKAILKVYQHQIETARDCYRHYVLWNLTNITEKEFTNKYNENVENIPISKLRESEYKDLRILYAYIYAEEEKNEED